MIGAAAGLLLQGIGSSVHADGSVAGRPVVQIHPRPGQPLTGAHPYYTAAYLQGHPNPYQHPSSSGNVIPLTSNNLNYYGGPVDHYGTDAMNILWQPYGGSTWNTYNGYMNQLYSDITNSGSGTGYYGNLTQYYDVIGGTKTYIPNYSAFIASWQDTQGYPSSGYVDDATARAEVERAIQVNGWALDSLSQYNVYLGTNSSGGSENACLNGSCFLSGQLCGWHGVVSYQGVYLSYAVIPYGTGPGNGCAPHKTGSSTLYCPNGQNGGCNVDSALDTSGHETFEVTTDPEPNVATAWADSSGAEIADKCVGQYDNLVYDNGQANHYFNNRRYYALQDDWDNHVTGCTPYGPNYP